LSGRGAQELDAVQPLVKADPKTLITVVEPASTSTMICPAFCICSVVTLNTLSVDMWLLSVSTLLVGPGDRSRTARIFAVSSERFSRVANSSASLDLGLD
jgi:hypothetical protein